MMTCFVGAILMHFMTNIVYVSYENCGKGNQVDIDNGGHL